MRKSGVRLLAVGGHEKSGNNFRSERKLRCFQRLASSERWGSTCGGGIPRKSPFCNPQAMTRRFSEPTHFDCILVGQIDQGIDMIDVRAHHWAVAGRGREDHP